MRNLNKNTKKHHFYVIFGLAALGFISSINLIYYHFNSSNNNQETKNLILNQKLSNAEKQIRIISSENTSLQGEIDQLQQKISKLSNNLAV